MRQTIREALASCTFYGKLRTFPIGYAEGSTVVKAEIKFREIAVKMFLFAM